MNTEIKTRTEKDLLGFKEVPFHCYYGVQTLRAFENLNLTQRRLSDFPIFIQSLAMIKMACAESNFSLGKLRNAKFEAIQYACKQLMSGLYRDQFPIDMMQGGAGTSINMNANQVTANIGLEHMGYLKGEYQYLHPNNDVNKSQSTNDMYPSAIKLALNLSLEKLYVPFQNLIHSLQAKSDEFSEVLKMCRTQLQDAVPMTLGQEFGAFAHTLQKDLNKIKQIMPDALSVINLGSTTIGTGINTEVQYRINAVPALAKITGKSISSSPDLIEATSDMGDFVLLLGFLKRTATKLSKMSNDLRLLSSGPRAGLGEIQLEPRQPDSSIMPCKVNPVIPEAMNLSCFQVVANDLAVTLAAEAGQLQLNAMEPLIAFKLFESIDLLGKAMRMLEQKCIQNIQAKSENCQYLVDNSFGINNVLNPYQGYETTTKIAKQANETGQSVLALIKAEKLLSDEVLSNVLSVKNMVQPMH